MADEKRVRITIEMDSTFIRLLNANVMLDGGLTPDKVQDVRGVLARTVLAEARGAHETQVDLIVPPEWRANIEAIHDERRVFEADDGG